MNRPSSKRSNRSSTKRRQDESVALEMDRIWKPVFDKYDSDHDGRIPVNYFKEKLREANNALDEDIPQEILDEIVERADWQQDGIITYDEFLYMVNARDIGAHNPRLQRIIRYAAVAVVPRNKRRSFIRSYLQEYNCAPPPFFVILASIIEIGVFVFYCIQMDQFGASEPVPTHSIFIYNPRRRWQVWRFLTYALIHAGALHLIFNVLIQLIIGVPLEMVHKWWRIGLVYMSGVLAGSFGSSFSDPSTYLAGASGGVYALIAAHLSNVIINWKEMEFAAVRLICFLAFAIADIGVAVYERYAKATQNRISYSAHLMGSIAGFLIGVAVLRNLKVKRWEKIFCAISISIYIILLTFSIFFNIFPPPDYFLKQDYSEEQQYVPKPKDKL